MKWKPEELSIPDFFNWYYSFRKYDTETYLYYKNHINEISSINTTSIFEEMLFKYNLSRSEIPTLYKIKDKLQINTEEEKEFINHICFCINAQNNKYFIWY